MFSLDLEITKTGTDDCAKYFPLKTVDVEIAQSSVHVRLDISTIPSFALIYESNIISTKH